MSPSAATEHDLVSVYGSKLVHGAIPGNPEGAVDSIDAVIARVEADDRLPRSDLRLEPVWKIESQGKRCEATLGGGSPWAAGSCEPD